VFIITCVVIGFSFVTVEGCIITAQTRDYHYNKIYEEVDDVLRNQVSVLSSDTYNYEKDKREKIQEMYSKYAEKTLECSIKYKFIAIIVVIALLAMFIWRCVHLFKDKRLPYAIIISIFMIMFSMFNKILSHTDAYKDMVYRYGILLDSLNLFNNLMPSFKRNITSLETFGQQPEKNVCISLQNVWFEHPDALRPILKDVSIDFKCNESVAIIGNVGSGKSTLLKVMLRYMKPTKGTLYLYGQPYSKLDPIEIRKTIGYIHQLPILFNRTIIENIVYGQQGITEEDVWTCLRNFQTSCKLMWERMEAGCQVEKDNWY
jgi:ABC-type multidrug transport system fused ATPase/permease subunit